MTYRGFGPLFIFPQNPGVFIGQRHSPENAIMLSSHIDTKSMREGWRAVKTVLIIILVLVGLTVGVVLLPAIIGIAAGVALFKSGHYIWALICISCGIAVNIGLYGGGSGSGGSSTYNDEECPYCGGGDTDGNHCYTCDEDF